MRKKYTTALPLTTTCTRTVEKHKLLGDLKCTITDRIKNHYHTSGMQGRKLPNYTVQRLSSTFGDEEME